jgi:hypothetical protein
MASAPVAGVTRYNCALQQNICFRPEADIFYQPALPVSIIGYY